jgi:integrase
LQSRISFNRKEITMESTRSIQRQEPWNKGKLVGQKAPFKLKEIWAIRVRLQMQRRMRELAMFNLGIDSKLRACDLVSLRVRDVCHDDRVAGRGIVMQQKTQRPVQFEITPSTREAVEAWIRHARPSTRGLPVPEPATSTAAPGYPSVREDRQRLG